MIASVSITVFTVLFVLTFERLDNPIIKKIFNWLPSILLAYLIPAAISFFLYQDYSQVTLHQWSKDLFIPLAIVSVMSSLSFPQLKLIGWKPIAVFFFWFVVDCTFSCWIYPPFYAY